MKRSKELFFEQRQLERKIELEKEQNYERIRDKRGRSINCL